MTHDNIYNKWSSRTCKILLPPGQLKKKKQTWCVSGRPRVPPSCLDKSLAGNWDWIVLACVDSYPNTKNHQNRRIFITFRVSYSRYRSQCPFNIHILLLAGLILICWIHFSGFKSSKSYSHIYILLVSGKVSKILHENIGPSGFFVQPCHLCGRLISHLAQNKGHLPVGTPWELFGCFMISHCFSAACSFFFPETNKTEQNTIGGICL